MRKILPLAALLLCLLGGRVAWAVNCPSFPFILLPGQIASATQVMADLNNLLTCANTILGKFTGPASSTDGDAVCFNGTTGQFGRACGAIGSVSGAVANPAGTTSTSLVMMGIGNACVFTPNRSGKVMLIISGDAANLVGGEAFLIRSCMGPAGRRLMAWPRPGRPQADCRRISRPAASPYPSAPKASSPG